MEPITGLSDACRAETEMVGSDHTDYELACLLYLHA